MLELSTDHTHVDTWQSLKQCLIKVEEGGNRPQDLVSSTVWTDGCFGNNDIDVLRNTRRDNRPPRMQLSRYALQA